jgi:hypothetical protein
MRIRILRDTSISGRAVRPGDVVDPSETDARILLRMGKAELMQDPVPAPDSGPVVQPPRKLRTRKG